MRRFRLRALLLVAVWGFLLSFGACAVAPFVDVQNHPARPAPRPTDALGPEDTISVIVDGQGELSGDFTLDESGSYGHPVIGRVTVGGLVAADAAKKIAGELQGKVVNPRVTVSVIHRVVNVSVFGEVNSPGVYSVPSGENVLQALARAGGVTSFAHKDRIFVMGPTLPMRVRLNYKNLTEGHAASLRFTLRDGDIVIVE